MDIEFDLRTEGDELPDAFLDHFELEMMFDSTRTSIRTMLERELGDVLCDEHAQAPRFKITGVYDNTSEQMDIHYHVDTCCQLFLVRVMRILNRKA
jgi:hypothetical protein